MKTLATALALAVCGGLVLPAGCGSDDDDGDKTGGVGGSGGSPDNTGSKCETPVDCYPGIDGTTLSGEVQCLDRIDEGYCTHLCATDADCCAVDGECKTDLKQVCSPFESTKVKMCFLSCENADLVPPDGGGPVGPEEYCQRFASPDFTCRSSGGGSENRKICVPGDCDVGEACEKDDECASGLTCITSFKGGYCGEQDCTVNADCPTGSVCVDRGGTAYCMKSCTADTDCSLCRPWELRGACSSEVTFVEATTTGSVCLPPE